MKHGMLPGWIGPAGIVITVALSACASQPGPIALSPAAQKLLTEPDSGAPAPTDDLSVARDAARRNPNDEAAQERYARAAERARLYPEALAALDRANAVGGVTESRLLEQGRIGLEAGDVPAAVRSYTAALQRQPNDTDALSGLGVAEDLQRHHAEAQARYREALRLAPGDWGIRGNLALSLLMSDQPDDAVAALSGGDEGTMTRRARHDLALALVAAGKRDQALAILRQDMPAADAAAMADEFATFARWLAGPDGTRAVVR